MARGLVKMIDKYGTVYNPITADNDLRGSGEPYHPNAGYDLSEIVDVMNWFMVERPDTVKKVYELIDNWIMYTLARCIDKFEDGYNIPKDEMFEEVFLGYTKEDLSDNLWHAYSDAYDYIHSDESMYLMWNQIDPMKVAKEIADILNQYFLRVRKGGKYNYDREDTIYFRISSKGYDWRRVIFDFLYDTYLDIKYMPSKIWVGHDEENNPPEVTLFYGSPEEFLDADSKVYESYKKTLVGNKFINKERSMIYKNLKLREAYKSSKKEYKKLV